jgi:hypothetical protein
MRFFGPYELYKSINKSNNKQYSTEDDYLIYKLYRIKRLENEQQLTSKYRL